MDPETPSDQHFWFDRGGTHEALTSTQVVGSSLCEKKWALYWLYDPGVESMQEVSTPCGSRSCKHCNGAVALYDARRYSLAIVDSGRTWYQFDIPQVKVKAALEYTRSKEGMALAIPREDGMSLLLTTDYSPNLRRVYGWRDPDGSRVALELTEAVESMRMDLVEYLSGILLAIPADRRLRPNEMLRSLRNEIQASDISGAPVEVSEHDQATSDTQNRTGKRKIPIVGTGQYTKAKNCQFKVDPLDGVIFGLPKVGSTDWVVNAPGWGLDLSVAYTPEQYAIHLSNVEASQFFARRVA